MSGDSDLFLKLIADLETNRKGSFVLDMAIISLLIEKDIITVPEVSERIHKIHDVLGKRYQKQDLLHHTEKAILFLQAVYAEKKPRWTPEVIQGGLPSLDPDQQTTSKEE